MEAGVVEGATRLFPPTVNQGERGPGRKDPEAPFYNPAMGLNRDLSVLLVEAFAAARGREVDVADVLAGTGARTVRLAHEVEAPLIVHANDADPSGIRTLLQAAEANQVPEGRITVTEGPAHRFLADGRFDVVDVDPYGSPMPFLDAAVRATRHGGLVCITATDTGALSGTYPKACRRRYGAEPLHRPSWRAEVGLRILQGTVVRAAGRLDRAAEPILAIAQGHWMRVVMRIRDGRAAADRAARAMGYVQEDGSTGVARWTEAGAGPLWTGPLHEAATVTAMRDAIEGHALAEPRKAARFLERAVEEADAPPFWLPLDTAASRLGGDVPPRERAQATLQAAGFQATRTHMDPQGLRTDATPDDVQRLWPRATKA